MAETVPVLLDALIRKMFKVWKSPVITTLVGLLLVIRVVLIAIPELNYCYHVAEVFVYTEIIHVVVVLTGVFVFLGLSASILSFWYHLRLRHLIRTTQIKDLKDWHVPIIAVLTVGSILHAVWIFMLVRRIWVSHFFILIQFLQGFPNILLVIQSISQGVYLVCVYARKGDTTRNSAAGDFSQHLNSHGRLNLILLVYSLIMLVKTIKAEENINLVLPSVLSMLEILYRAFIFYAMNNLDIPPNETKYIVPVEATDDCTSPVTESLVFGNEPPVLDPVLKPFAAPYGDNLIIYIQTSSQQIIIAAQEEIQHQQWKSEQVIGGI